jgi:hypothetical protein
VKYGINLVASLAFAFKISAATLLTVQFQHENSCIERNYKKFNVLYFEKMWIKICHLETGKSRIWAEFFFLIIVSEYRKWRKVADSLLILCCDFL